MVLHGSPEINGLLLFFGTHAAIPPRASPKTCNQLQKIGLRSNPGIESEPADRFHVAANPSGLYRTRPDTSGHPFFISASRSAGTGTGEESPTADFASANGYYVAFLGLTNCSPLGKIEVSYEKCRAENHPLDGSCAGQQSICSGARREIGPRGGGSAT